MGFNFFNKKSDKARVAPEIIPSILGAQLTLCDRDADVITADHWALGYIFGFHDGVLQALQINDQTKSLAIMAISYHKLFGNIDVSAKLLNQCLDLQGEHLFREGVFAGGEEAVSYIRDQKLPMGLVSYIKNKSIE